MEELKIVNLYNLEETIAHEYMKSKEYPWELLSGISDFIKELGKKLSPDIFEHVGEYVWIAKSSTVAPTALINGPCIIDEKVEVRHCAFIRGSVIVGKKCVVGNSTELKNSILFNGVQVPHYNYVGDSILGHKAHMGAGSITCNVKSDRSLVKMIWNGEEIETGLKKIGSMIGDCVEIGCNTVLNPDTIIGRNTSIYPLSIVRGYVPPDVIYKKQGEVVGRIYDHDPPS